MMRKFVAAILVLLVFPVVFDAAPSGTRTVRGLVVLIDFPDMPATVSISRANDILNGIGYTEPNVTKSLTDYWYAQSRGHVVMTSDVFGYYRAPLPSTSYDFAGFIGMMGDALDWIVANNPEYDWDALSLSSGPMNRNGTEEGKFLSIAFMTTAWIPGSGGTHFWPWTAPNGVGTQQVTASTFQAPWDTNINLFWLTHEQGHAIWGWPDTYDTTTPVQSHGTGIYSLMSGNQGTGDIEPPGAPFLAAEGWTRVMDIKRNQTIVLEPDGDLVARYVNPTDSREYFVIEARSEATIGNASLPVDAGLLIWHVDERVTTYNTMPQMTPAQHYRISLEQADGHFDLEHLNNPGDAGDIFLPGDVFSPLTTPDSNWWDGSWSSLTIDSIRFLPNGRISFRAAVSG